MHTTAVTITDAQIDAIEHAAIRDGDDALAKECRITRLGSASKARIALARARCAAAHNLTKETP